MLLARPQSNVQGPKKDGFTLIEIMVVVAIMAIVMAMGVPFAYRALHKEGLIAAVGDVVEVCSNARARAIMRGTMTEVVFHPKSRTLEVSGAGATGGEPLQAGAMPVSPSGSGLSAHISDRINIEMLDVNLSEYKDAETARVRFYPNGTCDEMTLILHSDQNEWRKISLEITTSLASVESDPTKWK
jgi:prepilin-type N-terminal cleavage/methylation domain-containing protein